MRRTPRTLFGQWFVLGLSVLCLPAAAFAQSPNAPTRLDLSKIKPGERIFVTDRTGVQTEGRLLRISPQELTLLVDGHERLLSSNDIGRIEKRDSVWNGMLIGAVPAALVGGAAAGASCSPHCGRDVPQGMVLFGAIGAGLGALVDAGIRGYAIVAGPPLNPPNALRTPPPVISLDELWRRVRQGDTIEVTKSNGQRVTGTFARASTTSVVLKANGDYQQITASDVRRVRRAGNRYRAGALWGGAIMGTAFLVSSAACSGGGCGNPLFVAMFSGSAGAVWGALIGAGIPKHPVVYEPGAYSALRVAPIIGRSRFGAALSTTF